jgi:hypothetical protein
MELQALPLTPNGKVDRKALPRPLEGKTILHDDGGDVDFSPVEKDLLGIWAEVLGVQSVGLNDSFFDLGGHSLLIVEAVNKILQVLPEHPGSEVLIMKMFEYPTVRSFAGYLAGQLVEERTILPDPLKIGTRVESMSRQRETRSKFRASQC